MTSGMRGSYRREAHSSDTWFLKRVEKNLKGCMFAAVIEGRPELLVWLEGLLRMPRSIED